jgi:hypothetical protein
MLGFSVDNIYAVFGDKVLQQSVSIPMGTNYAPILADLFIYSYDAEFVFKKLSLDKNKKICRVLQLYIQVYRWCTVNQQSQFSQLCVHDISRWTRIKGHHRINISASYLDILLYTDSNGILTITSYDKHYDFNFAIVNSPFLCSNIIPLSHSNGVYYLPVDSIRKRMFCIRELFKTKQTTDKKVYLAGLWRILFKVIISQILRSQ